MENIVIFTLNIFMLIFIWNVGFKPAIKARKRVHLKILRLDVDRYFNSIDRGGSIDPMQNRLVGVIENTSHALDTVSLSSYLAWSKEIDKHHDLKSKLRNEIGEKFHTNDPEKAKVIKKVRSETSMIGLSYMIESSFFLLLFSFIYAVFFFAAKIVKQGKIQLKYLKPDVEAKAEKILDADFIAQKSFLMNKTC